MCSTSKRGLDGVGEIEGLRFKIPRYSHVYRLQSESELESDWDEKESMQSFQLAETASPHDTSDTTDKSDEEFSLISESEKEAPEVSSGSDEVILVGDFEQIASELGSEISVVADLSDSRSTSGDSEIGPADYWKCVMCHTTNKNPCVRYCEKCFRLRRSTCPPRPKNKKKQKKKKQLISSGGSGGEGLGPSSSPLGTHDSGLGLSQQSQSPEPEDMSVFQTCNSCYERPANGLFVHKKTGHQVFCYKCSQRIWMERKKCPYCNRAIQTVVQIFKVSVLGEN